MNWVGLFSGGLQVEIQSSNLPVEDLESRCHLQETEIIGMLG
jgi:hypothetical protein